MIQWVRTEATRTESGLATVQGLFGLSTTRPKGSYNSP